ncbi:MAG: NUDIX domain-containing protein [Nitrospirae bacterium]|nr:NUDIX domain-containing protein [Nitrospirota bacterium]
MLDIVNAEGRVIGSARRCEAHGNNCLLHRVVHLFVFDDRGRLLLQKRSMNKDVAAGKWDTSVGGHVNCGESVSDALIREMGEELGITVPVAPRFLYTYVHSNDHESELVYSYSLVYTGEIKFAKAEIDEIRYWEMEEIRQLLGSGTYSDNFEHEFNNYLALSEKL